MADFTAYEHRYHLTHHFPSLSGGHRMPSGHMVAEGRIDERQPWQGLQLVGSDLIVHQTYETHARRDAPAHVSIIVLLEGCAELALGDRQHTLTAGDGLLLAYDRRCPLRARHVANQRVRAVNLTVVTNSLGNDPRLTAHLAPLLEHTPGGLWPVAVPAGLRQSLAEWLAATPVDSLAPLMAEGLALQLMAHGLAHWQAEPTPLDAPITPRDQRLLARVRHRLESRPGEAHTLKALAELACMSPSTLREKFRLAYGQSVFDHLRECRLALAHRQLQAGLSVQQVAAQVGYRHATNFATAFRQRYGIAPREVR